MEFLPKYNNEEIPPPSTNTLAMALDSNPIQTCGQMHARGLIMITSPEFLKVDGSAITVAGHTITCRSQALAQLHPHTTDLKATFFPPIGRTEHSMQISQWFEKNNKEGYNFTGHTEHLVHIWGRWTRGVSSPNTVCGCCTRSPTVESDPHRTAVFTPPPPVCSTKRASPKSEARWLLV